MTFTIPALDDPIRVEKPPEQCPRCKRVHAANWHPYKLTPGLPSCGCGNCGYVVWLKPTA